MIISPNKWELDVQGYLNVCNITAATPRKQIRDFSAGINDLGLWNSMVCWPLRSSQNYGSGTTAFSLGGLGTYNGTLENGPTWATDGAELGAGTIRTGMPPWSSAVTFMLVHKVTNVANTNLGITVTDDATGSGALWGPLGGIAYWDCMSNPQRRTSGSINVTAGSFFSHIGQGDGTSIRQYLNGSTLISQANSPAFFGYTPLRMVLGSASQYFGTVAFAARIDSASASATTLYSLYKSTLGTGITLP